jgi:hypothetical protein
MSHGVDRLTITDEGEVTSISEGPEMPEEELLRLDDGTLLPSELAELRSLLQLHSMALGGSDNPGESEEEGVGEHAAQLAVLADAKTDMLRDCLLEFDESILLLHDKLLDHEALCKRLAVVRKAKAAPVPAGRCDYDEAIAFDDDDTDAAAASDRYDADDDEDAFDLSDLLKVDGPAGAGTRGGGTGGGALSSSRERGSSAAGVGSTSIGECSGPPSSAAAAAAAAEEEEEEEEEEETLDQRVATSRQEIRTLIRAMERGKQATAEPTIAGGRSAGGRSAGGGKGAGGKGARAAAVNAVDPAAGVTGARRSLPPVVPPPRARQSSYSARLRMTASTWSAKEWH